MNSMLGRARRAEVFCSWLRICLVLVAIAVKFRCFCQPERISITLLEENVYCTENFMRSLLFATTVHRWFNTNTAFWNSGLTFINKKRDVSTHGGTHYIKDGITFIRRTDLEINELECIWLEINFPNTKSFPNNAWYRLPSTSEFLPTNFNQLLRNSLIKVSSENKETISTGDFDINYQQVDNNSFPAKAGN